MRLLKVLIVDDEDDWTIPFKENLEVVPIADLAGDGFDSYQFKLARNQREADQAVAEAGASGYDVVFLDLRYPLDEEHPLDPNAPPPYQGLKWLPLLRLKLPHATIIVLTNYPDTETLGEIVSAIRDHGANDFIPKGEIDDIIPRIRVAYETAQRMQRLMTVETEFFSLLRTRAARSQTYAEDVAALLGRAKTSLSRIAQRIESGDDSAIEGAANAIRSEFEYVTKEFDNLTQVLNKGQEELATIDVVAEVRLMVRLYQKMIDDAQIEVVAPEATQSLSLKTYKGDLKVALHEVVTNALESLRSSTRPDERGRLLVSVEKIGDDAVVRIADNGPGFCDDAIAQMFERGFTTRGGEHQGLGLYIAKRMMNQIGGDIEARNNSERGAEVFLTVKSLGES